MPIFLHAFRIYLLYTYIYIPSNIWMTGQPGHLTPYCACTHAHGVITVKGLGRSRAFTYLEKGVSGERRGGGRFGGWQTLPSIDYSLD